MANRSVEKVVAAQLLESVKAAGNHLSRLRIECVGSKHSSGTMQGAKAISSEVVMDLYTRVRRLRDHLRRCVAAYPTMVEIDLDEDDAVLLVSCIVFRLESLQSEVVSPDTRPGDRPWLKEVAANLAVEAMAFADGPVAVLPNPFGRSPTQGISVETVRAINEAHEERVRADFKRRASQPIDPCSTPTHAGGFGGSSLEGSEIRRITLQSMIPGVEAAPPPTVPLVRSAPPVAPPVQATPIAGGTTHSPQSSVDDFAAELDGEFSSEPEVDAGVEAEVEAERASVFEVDETTSSLLFDPRYIRDPRLRGIMLLDLRAQQRASEANDYRLGAVHLASILEGALIDHALTHAKEFELTGTPYTWVLSDILARLYDDDVPARERLLFSQLIASRRLLLPSQQLEMPMVMTASLYEQLGVFVTGLLAKIGLIGNVQSSAPFGPPPQPRSN